MKKYLVITNNKKYYLIEAISSISAAKKLTILFIKEKQCNFRRSFWANQKCREYYRFN